MRLWIESAHECVSATADASPRQKARDSAGDWVRTLTTEDQFLALFRDAAQPPRQDLASQKARDVAFSGGEGWSEDPRVLWEVQSELERDVPLDTVAATLVAALPEGVHLPLTILQVRSGGRASLFECDAPPLFMARGGQLVLLPVVEEEFGGRLIRRCEFELQDGDHMAMVSEGFLQGVRWDRRWGWRDVAVATRRLTETRCDAGQLAGALVRQYQRLAGNEAAQIPELGAGSGRRRNPEAGSWQSENSAGHDETQLPVSSIQYPVSVLAMFVRPMRTLTLWSGPPASRAAEREVLDRLMAEEDFRVICGDTTAEIAARLLGAQLVMERRPPDGWREVPPASRMVGPAGKEEVDLVTEGVVTMTVARERLASAHHPRDLTGKGDGASRLAWMLLTADKVKFLVGRAVNRAQVAADGTPLRRMAVDALVADLKARGKIVLVQYF